MDKPTLPRQWFSYSQFNLWRSSKEQYRQKYYLNQPTPETPEMIFGKLVARYLEDRRRLRKIKRLPISEYRLEFQIEGIPILGYLDAFDPATCAIQEFKTSRVGWDKLKVAKHDQLPFYSLGVKTIFGKVENKLELIWLETRFKKAKTKFAGHTLTADSRELELAGRHEIFERVIREWERKKIREEILETVNEISNDYQSFQKANHPILQ